MPSFRVLGVDPGSLSWDFFGLNDNKIILDASIPTKEVFNEPEKVIDLINTIEDVDLMVAPSGFGLPLKKVEDLTEKDLSLTLLKFNEGDKTLLLGLGKVLELLKKEKIPGVIVPGVKHLPTVPRYRKINKIDMGTADKLCTAVTGIRDQMERYSIGPENTNFIMVEIGYGFTAVLAIENGQIIDGIGGTNIMGFRACGALDGELAYLVRNVKKRNIYQGGVSTIAGYEDLSIDEIILLAQKDEQTDIALKAYIESVKKAVYGIASIFSRKNEVREVLLAGRGAELKYLRNEIVDQLKDIADVRLMKSYSHLSKRAAQGAAFIANGLLGGRFEPIVSNLRLKEAKGTILDDIFIPFEKEKLFKDVN